MHLLSTTLIKVSLILFAASHIAIAGPVPDVGSDISVGDRERISSEPLSNSKQDGGGDFLGSLSGNSRQGGKGSEGGGERDKKVEKPANHNKGVGGSSLAGTRHKQVDPYTAFDEGESAQGGSVSGGGGVLNVLSGNGGDGGGGGSVIRILDIFPKKNL